MTVCYTNGAGHGLSSWYMDKTGRGSSDDTPGNDIGGGYALSDFDSYGNTVSPYEMEESEVNTTWYGDDFLSLFDGARASTSALLTHSKRLQVENIFVDHCLALYRLYGEPLPDDLDEEEALAAVNSLLRATG